MATINFQSKRVVELKRLCTERSLDTTGLKEALVQRLTEHEAAERLQEAAAVAAAAQAAVLAAAALRNPAQIPAAAGGATPTAAGATDTGGDSDEEQPPLEDAFPQGGLINAQPPPPEGAGTSGLPQQPTATPTSAPAQAPSADAVLRLTSENLQVQLRLALLESAQMAAALAASTTPAQATTTPAQRTSSRSDGALPGRASLFTDGPAFQSLILGGAPSVARACPASRRFGLLRARGGATFAHVAPPPEAAMRAFQEGRLGPAAHDMSLQDLAFSKDHGPPPAAHVRWQPDDPHGFLHLSAALGILADMYEGVLDASVLDVEVLTSSASNDLPADPRLLRRMAQGLRAMAAAVQTQSFRSMGLPLYVRTHLVAQAMRAAHQALSSLYTAAVGFTLHSQHLTDERIPFAIPTSRWPDWSGIVRAWAAGCDSTTDSLLSVVRAASQAMAEDSAPAAKRARSSTATASGAAPSSTSSSSFSSAPRPDNLTTEEKAFKTACITKGVCFNYAAGKGACARGICCDIHHVAPGGGAAAAVVALPDGHQPVPTKRP